MRVAPVTIFLKRRTESIEGLSLYKVRVYFLVYYSKERKEATPAGKATAEELEEAEALLRDSALLERSEESHQSLYEKLGEEKSLYSPLSFCVRAIFDW